MTMQASLAVFANKTQVVFSAAAFAAPSGSTTCSIYVNTPNTWRDNDVRSCVEKLMNYAKAHAATISAQLVLGGVPLYLVMGLGEGYGAISLTSLLGDIVAGKVGLGFGIAVPTPSSEPVNTCCRQIRDRMWEAERIYA